ncbi:MAG: hypothetical protein SWY16_24400 [Cyanobacteriota bacterium]|nr:hypothetical protein [Cyanobacteriota bacterium]
MKIYLKGFTSLLLAFISIGMFSIEPALAFEEDAECLDLENEFDDCKIIFKDDVLNIEYDDDDEAELNLSISVDRISSASSVEYYTHGFLQASGLRNGILIDYFDDENQLRSKVLEIHPRDGFIFLSLLRQSGVEIDWNLRDR